MSEVLKVNLDSLKATAANNDRVIVKVSTSSCGPCKMLAPIFDGLNSEIEDVVFASNVIDMEEAALEAGADSVRTEYGVQSVPTLLMFENGELVNRHTGMMNKGQLEEFIGVAAPEEADMGDFGDL
ncbi:thioredoxin family protein [Neptuniibacter sp. QD37_11]|uniref:thioredoxin family protein n=1 Tax=Neptuniibacter sp. QD37_11 TaxID=3398209 RepID=UPI0039F5A8B3